MVRTRSSFVCQQCGYSQSQWAGKCPSCDVWNSMVETTFEVQRSTGSKAQSGQIFKLQDIKIDEKKRLKTGEAELDNVLGGGLVGGMVILVAGEPGIGKSTLLTQVALRMGSHLALADARAKNDLSSVLYVCGEESATQVALRVGRIGSHPSRPTGHKGNDPFLLLESTDVDEIVNKIEEIKVLKTKVV